MPLRPGFRCGYDPNRYTLGRPRNKSFGPEDDYISDWSELLPSAKRQKRGPSPAAHSAFTVSNKYRQGQYFKACPSSSNTSEWESSESEESESPNSESQVDFPTTVNQAPVKTLQAQLNKTPQVEITVMPQGLIALPIAPEIKCAPADSANSAQKSA